MFQLEHISDLRLYVQNAPTGTYKRFYRNTVEISENSENHLEAIVCGLQMAEVDGFKESPRNAAKKTQGEGKALKVGRRVE